MLTPQANTFGLVALGYSNLLPPIIRQAVNALSGVTPRYTTSRGVYDEINLWKAASRRTHEFRAACSLFATICVAFQLLFFATFVLCNFCGFTLVRFALGPSAGQNTDLPRFLVHDCDAGKFKGPPGGVSELAGCHCNVIEAVTLGEHARARQ